MIRANLTKAFEYHESLARAIYESSALYFGQTLLSKKNGDLPAKILFVSDVPEVHAAAVTGVAFTDPTQLGTAQHDAAGHTIPSPAARRFGEFTKPLGLQTPDVKKGWAGQKVYFAYFIPRHPCTPDHGHRAPTATEIKIALQLLNAQVNLAQPRLIVPLGNAANKAVTKLLRLKELSPVAKETRAQADWGPVTIYPLTHPRPKERLHRPDWQQKLDWKKLAKIKNELR